MLDDLSGWLEATAISQSLRSLAWAVPGLQTVHIVAMAVVVVFGGLLHLRVLGLAGRRHALPALGQRLLPWVWRALVVLAITGVLQVVAEPQRELLNTVFRIKMLLVLGLVVLTAWLSLRLAQGAAPGRWAAALSMLCWIGIVIAGRWIAYY